MCVRDLTGYQKSRDYALLWELGQKQSIVCIADYGDYGCRDVAQTIWDGKWLRVACRGTGYADGETAEDFSKWCSRANIEFLVPNVDHEKHKNFEKPESIHPESKPQDVEEPREDGLNETTCSPLDDFLAHAEAYNAVSVVKYIAFMVRRSAHLTSGEITVTVSGIDSSKSIKDVLKWCSENPQPADKLSKAVKVMVSGWERAKFMELLDEANVKLWPVRNRFDNVEPIHGATDPD